MNQHHNLKTIPCWVCKQPTRCGVEAVRVICHVCVQAGATFGRKPPLAGELVCDETPEIPGLYLAATK